MSARTLEFVVPGDLRSPTGGYHYDRRIIDGLRSRGWRVTVHALDASFPFPAESATEHARGVFAGIGDDTLVLVDGLAFGAIPDVVKSHSERLTLVALVHHPLAAESGLSADAARELERSEREALKSARHVVVTSQRTGQALRSYGVEPERVSVVEPGTDEAPLAGGTRALRRGASAKVLKMLCVASVTPRKGYDVLIDALSPLAKLSWHLTCVGDITRDHSTAKALRARSAASGLLGRVTWVGEVADRDVTNYYQASSLFVLPTLYEGYGMAVAEAVAHGLPVISTPTGAIPELVRPDAGILVPPGNVQALTDALSRVMQEPALLASLAQGARAARSRLPRWSDACERMSVALEQAARR